MPGPDNRLDAQVPLSANLGLDYKARSMPLTLSANFSYQGAGPVRRRPSSAPTPRRALDLYGLWKFDPKHQLRVSLSNALHQHSYNETLFAEPGRTSLTQSRSRSHASVRVTYGTKL